MDTQNSAANQGKWVTCKAQFGRPWKFGFIETCRNHREVFRIYIYLLNKIGFYPVQHF